MTPDRCIVLPVRAGASWANFGWIGKYPSDDLDYGLDATDWLEANGFVLLSATVSASPDLDISELAYGYVDGSPTSVLLRISGGTPGSAATVSILLLLAGGRRITVAASLPIRADAPAGLSAVAPAPVGILSGEGLILTDDSGNTILPE